ncbi:MAG: LURP-one-related family protein [Erysipelotrichaceae bacterium]|jgi:uncharacterized protein YxjI|nr:LURP-one-related family protein [Erysipelotrichaceae bacterium]
MKLYMKQKVFSWRDKFSIFDEQGAERWAAKGEILTIGRKLHIYDLLGNEAAFIHQKVLTFLPRYFIDIKDKTYTMVKELTLLKPRFRIEGTNWKASGDFLAHEYRIDDDVECIMSISKRWISFGDSYELNIEKDQNELLALCVALTIDCMNADADNANNAGSE